MNKKTHFIHCHDFSGLVITEGNIVVDAPPTASIFVGQELIALKRFASARGAYSYEEI